MRWTLCGCVVFLGCGDPADGLFEADTGLLGETDVVDSDDTDLEDSDIEPAEDTDVDPPEDPVPIPRRFDCGGIEPADAGPLGGRIALTFDDGPDSLDTPAILEVLRAHQAPATFFVLGERLVSSSTWDIVDDIVADPLFALANHSWDHANLVTLTPAAVVAQIEDTSDLISTFGPAPDFFRFPYGSSTCGTHDQVTSFGMSVAGWHIDTGDWCYAAVGDVGVCEVEDYWRIPELYEADMRGFIVEQAERYDGGVVLFHDIHAWTAGVLDDVLLDLEAAGFTFVALDDADAFPNLVAGTPADIPYLGEACDTVDDLCFYSEYFSWCEPTRPADATSTAGICTMPCEGTCPDRYGAATTFCAELPTAAGQCTSRSDARNSWCDELPGASRMILARHVGSSGASSANIEVCAPDGWR